MNDQMCTGTRFFFRNALLPTGWARDVGVLVDDDGRIEAVEPGAPPGAAEHHGDVAVPGLPNLHSHAFQRAMAGLTEIKATGEDSFWTWRELMYRFVDRLTPKHMHVVAALAYMEMLEAGFTQVSEFHYLHHDQRGQPYSDPAAMAGALARAAGSTGIGFTLLPVFYGFGGFGGQPHGEGQKRFVNSVDDFARLHDACRAHLAPLPGAVLGLALHSLRAVTPASMAQALELAANAPVHIHVAEQRKEVDDCIAWCGRAPVGWLLDNAPVDGRWCLVHATHMDAGERASLARSGAVAGVCPITEANLGDGIFDGVRYLEEGGRFGVGSDSNTTLSASGELAMFEYSQRLRDLARNRLVDAGSTGEALFTRCLDGGAAASGTAVGVLAPGYFADFVLLDHDHPAFAGRGAGAWLDSWIFTGGNAAVDEVWVRGRRQVARGRHQDRERITRGYREAVEQLVA